MGLRFCTASALLILSLIGDSVPAQVAAAPELPKISLEQSAQYRVVRVVDGDTVVLLADDREFTVRLIGVDAPESVHPSVQEQPFGAECSAFLRNLLRDESVYMVLESGRPTKDKYGRLLAYLFRVPDGLFINLELIRQGYARAYTEFPFAHMAVFRAYESRAQIARKGLWGLLAAPVVNSVPGSTADSTATSGWRHEAIVYVTPNGKCYHCITCTSLHDKGAPISLEDATSRGYRPCSRCNPPCR